MIITSPAAAAEFAYAWIRETSPRRAQCAITSAIAGFTMNLLALLEGNAREHARDPARPHRTSRAFRTQRNRTSRTPIAPPRARARRSERAQSWRITKTH
jgi:hypothetical protein